MTNTQIQPWYKQFWPWFLITFPATAVIAGIATVMLAVKSNDGLVNDDYYKAGLAINKTLDRSQRARELAIRADITYLPATQGISMTVQGKLQPLPPRLQLQLAHATRANQDQAVTLLLAPDKKSYTARLGDIRAGHWILILQPEDQSWRIKARVKLPQQTHWHLQANQ